MTSEDQNHSVDEMLHELAEQVDEGKRTGPQLRAFLEGRNPFNPVQYLRLGDASNILGSRKILSLTHASMAFDHPSFAIDESIRYSEETLQKSSLMNRTGDFDWRLVYGLPLSLHEQRETIGADIYTKPCFFGNDWWMDQKEDSWAKSQPKTGYYLIDFKGRFNSTNWEDQNSLIAEMGDVYERADERVFAQALISIFNTFGERLYRGTYHWGRMEDSIGFRVSIGLFTAHGLGVSRGHPFHRGGNMLVSVARKWEF